MLCIVVSDPLPLTCADVHFFHLDALRFYTPLTASRFGNMRVAAACADGIYESVDRGLSWTKVYASEEAGKPSDKEQSLKYG